MDGFFFYYVTKATYERFYDIQNNQSSVSCTKIYLKNFF